MNEMPEEDPTIRLYKAAQMYNVATDTLVELLENEDLGYAVVGNGLNAKIEGEEAWLVLRKEFANDEKAEERLEEIRSKREEAGDIRFSRMRQPPSQTEPFGIATYELVENHDEGVKIEFKETARYHTHKKSFSENIKMEIVKTVSSFMNSMGGVLIVGVSDGGKIKGVSRDRFSSSDEVKNFMSNLLLDNLGIKCQKNVSVFVEEIEGCNLIRVECEKSSQPSFVSGGDGKNEMYIRYLESTVRLDAKGMYEYIPHRFLEDIAAKNYDKLAENLGRMSAVHPSGDGL